MTYDELLKALQNICASDKVRDNVILQLDAMNGLFTDIRVIPGTLANRVYRIGVIPVHKKLDSYRIIMADRALRPSYLLKLGLVLDKQQKQIIGFNPKIMETLY